ncbi:hypothetical protein [Methylococcus geothermalis]|uniref:Uncharacterized protein n=1 Tax=Methylococcus geothermalis TaxID=2681310 RepID=A0A858Q478_9GAMM|nr:hypothetical protein [Methylococcus geothermalis]QJD28624.1 hypothetical protein GNH96_00675 [Methylococcus geothermalis]
MDAGMKQRGEAVCARLRREIEKLGIAPDRLTRLPVYDEAEFEASKDPYSGEETLCGRWRDARGHSIGQMKFHGDGSFYAEFDVVLPHPGDPRWFVEGVTAWGRGDVIKSEAKLLEALGE